VATQLTPDACSDSDTTPYSPCLRARPSIGHPHRQIWDRCRSEGDRRPTASPLSRERFVSRPSTGRSNGCSGHCESGCGLPSCRSVFRRCNVVFFITKPGTTSIGHMHRSAVARPTKRGMASSCLRPSRFEPPIPMRSSYRFRDNRVMAIRHCR